MSIDIKIPEIGESISEATMGQWLKEDGEMVEMDDIICEIESEKATMELTAEDSGVLKILVEPGETLKIGTIIGKIDTDGKSKPKTGPPKEIKTADSKLEFNQTKVTPEKTENKATRAIKLSPVAKKILEEAGIDPADVKESVKDKKITKQDALAAVEQLKKKSTAKAVDETKSVIEPDSTQIANRTVNRVPMTTLRKTIARRLLDSKNGTAMLTTVNEVDMTTILEQRAKYKEHFKEKHGVRLGFMSFFTKAVCLALNEFPVINAAIEEDDIVYHNYQDIGIAVSTERGLVVPIIRNAGTMTMAQIEKEIETLATKATNNKLSIDEMTGGTFTITNGGVFGSLISTPIINAPQSAILGMHTIQERPVARNGEVLIKPMMYISLSYDHRIIDGKESVEFVVRLKQILEDPIRLLFDV